MTKTYNDSVNSYNPQIGDKNIVKMCLESFQMELSHGRSKYTKNESPPDTYPQQHLYAYLMLWLG